MKAKVGERMVKKMMIFAFIGIMLITAGLVLAQEPSPEPTPTTNPPAECYSCHLDVAVKWQFTSHALAYNNEAFQSAWFNQRSNPTCLACHTTGYTPRTQTYRQEGVACTACHGDTPTDHPPKQVAQIGGEVCADCHTTTYTEWEKGVHIGAGITCTSCHDPHQSGLIAQDSQILCVSCHETVEDNYAHVTHPEQQCVDCHYHAKADNTDHFISGNLRPSGHEGIAFTAACVDCHASLAQDGEAQLVAGAEASGHGKVSTPSVQQHPSLPFIQGILLGGGFGVTIMAFIIQLRRKRHR